MDGPGNAPTAPVPAQTRVAVAVLFLLLGGTVGGWLSRAPDVQAQVGVDDAGWGAVLACLPAGSLLGLGLVALLVDRAGPRRLVLVAAPGLLVVAPVLAALPRPALLGAALGVLGLCTGLLNTSMNALAVAVERAYARPVMSSFHACFSVGTLGGALLGAGASALRVPPAVQLALSSGVLAVLLALTVRALPVDPPRPATAGPAPRRMTPALALLAAMALCTLLAEGTASNWSALYVSRELAAGASVGAVAYACFTGAMTLGRVGGDRVVRRLGRPRALQLSGAVATAGLALALLAGTPLVACAGLLVLGLGLSCATPTIFGLAGNQPGVTAGAGLVTVTLTSWPAFLVGPPLVGALSSQVGLRLALAAVLVPTVLLAVLATAVRRQEPAPAAAGPGGAAPAQAGLAG